MRLVRKRRIRNDVGDGKEVVGACDLKVHMVRRKK